jgi:transcriptional regulator with XRE-family HTH domain
LGVASIGRPKPRQSPFAAWLEREMLARNLRVTDAAGAIGVPQSQISRYLNGKIFPSRSSVSKLAAWAGISTQEVWALIPEEGGGLRAAPAPADAAARLLALEAEARALRRLVGPFAPPDEPVTTRPGDPPGALVPRGGADDELLYHLTTDDLDTALAVKPITIDTVVWLDPLRPPLAVNKYGLPDCVVLDFGGSRYARVVGPDGVTLLSGVAGALPLRLDDPGVRVVGVVSHTQQAR